MRCSSCLLRFLTIAMVCGASISGITGQATPQTIASPNPVAAAAQPGDPDMCSYLVDSVDGEIVSIPIFVSGDRASAVDATEACNDQEFGASSSQIQVVATGEPDFLQHNARVTSIEVMPGAAVHLHIVVGGLKSETRQSDIAFLDAPVRWALSSRDDATIIPQTGKLLISERAPHGRMLTASAEVEIGEYVFQRHIEVLVYTREANPLAGAWEEVSHIPCDGAGEFAPDGGPGFLLFSLDGTFRMSLGEGDGFDTGFAGMYEGLYVIDLLNAIVTMIPYGQGTTPPGFDGSGEFAIDPDGTLVLGNMWLAGSSMPETDTVCGIRFVRTR